MSKSVLKGKTVYEVEAQSYRYSGEHKRFLIIARNVGEAEKKALVLAQIEFTSSGRCYVPEVKIIGTIDA